MSLVEAGIIGGPFCVILGMITIFTANSIRLIPKGDIDEDRCMPAGCRLPMMISHYSNRVTYRCTDCGKHWKIEVDLDLPRRYYRKWVPK